MNKCLRIIQFSIFFSIIFNNGGSAQDLVVEGSAKISVMNPATISAQPVGRETDGTLVSMPPMEATYAVGDFAQGGVVFWVTATGKHGRVASIYNIANVPYSNVFNLEIGGSAQSNKHGAGNSIAIVTQSGHTISAAQHCLDLAFAGYDDWYLPAKDELNRLFVNRTVIDSTSTANSGEAFEPVSYWSSTESELDGSEAWNQSFSGVGTQQVDAKSAPFYLRAIRAF